MDTIIVERNLHTETTSCRQSIAPEVLREVCDRRSRMSQQQRIFGKHYAM